MVRRDTKWFLTRCAVAAAVALGCLLLFGFFSPDCRFRALTGLPCPTCGMSRAWRCALSFDFGAAFFWHPLFWAVPPLALLLIFGDLKDRRIHRVLWITLALFLGVYLVRMILLFPHMAPMTFYPDGWIPRLLFRKG